MFDDLRDLYQEVILDHGKAPRNFRAIDRATCLAHGNNPICGDTLVVYLALGPDGRIADVSFQGQGCAISKASASMMTQIVKGKTCAEAEKLFDDVHALVTGHPTGADVGPLKSLSGVSKFPLRVKCASLAWHAMKSALHEGEAVSTEGDGPGGSGA